MNREKSISGKKDFEMKKKAVLMKCWITSKTAPFSDSPRNCAPKAEEQWTVNPPIQVRFLYSPYFCVNYFSNLK